MFDYNIKYTIFFIIFLFFVFYGVNYLLSYENFVDIGFNNNILEVLNNITIPNILDDNMIENNEPIPKIIIQTWKTNDIPEKYHSSIESVKKINKGFEYLYFTDDDIDTFLKNSYPEYYETYLKLPVVIQKIDFFRYIAVYHYGGFYYDLDMIALYPLDELLNYKCIFPIDEFIYKERCSNVRFQYFCNKKMEFLLGQYAFGARKNDPFIKMLIDGIHNNIDSYIALNNKVKLINDKKTNFNYIYKTTGPDYVTNMYYHYKNKNDIHILIFDKSQYFGKYAKHNCYGTWK